jgi:hypothetical protein
VGESRTPWCEVFTWELTAAEPTPAVSIRVVLHEDRAWYLAAVIGRDGSLVVVADLDVPLPTRPTSLELRTTGLWADHNIETPFAHVSVGLEAFGVALGDPADALTGGFGVRTPVGFDLEWEDTLPLVAGLGAEPRYEVAGRAHGEILLGTDTHEVDGAGHREHAWGPIDWSGPGWWRVSLRSTQFGNHLFARGAGEVGWAVTRPGGDPTFAALDVREDDVGLPAGASLRLGPGAFDLRPWSLAVVPLPGPAGARGTRLVSAPVDAVDPVSGAPVGIGWLERMAPTSSCDKEI